ncbi:Gfo/Idh/MocA family oxidoreductase [Pontibacter sp. G13]|uniref:Gfo/Idh/MocA family protein n=1 Tax=Pontibacter sp. G13 TaxID=3074898 RepID=UPI00288B30CC|nr:Gfo/Idh/MocA family oxidoreductase [Pontibacter sp. G13]WNJ21249.1 Gfo/Idh/MocA family oxidoreductase [Pontibacter sp. G13]
MNRKMRMGMVGGGIGAFIGAVHRMAAALDGQIELVCGAFSSNPERSKASGAELMLPADRVYGSFEEMILKEKELPEGERMDFVSIVTPNHMHFPPAKLALEHGFAVICDKPLAFNLEEAVELADLVESTGLPFALTHNYTGYPMVKQARQMIADGELGEIRKVVVEYPQGWLSTAVELTNSKQASWRTDPSKSGAAGAMGDIGTHAENLAEYITGLQITEMCADLSTFVEGRRLDDDGNVLLRFNNGAKGILHASQISNGEENDLNIRIYGEKGGLKWRQMEPNSLVHVLQEDHTRILRTGKGNLSRASLAAARIPSGHPEGYLEAFANIYKNFANTLRKTLNGDTPSPIDLDFPTVQDGVRGMEFIQTVVNSSNSDQKWYAWEHAAPVKS